jgi:hypothetical protein
VYALALHAVETLAQDTLPPGIEPISAPDEYRFDTVVSSFK